jgi:hypothetical protein
MFSITSGEVCPQTFSPCVTGCVSPEKESHVEGE